MTNEPIIKPCFIGYVFFLLDDVMNTLKVRHMPGNNVNESYIICCRHPNDGSKHSGDVNSQHQDPQLPFHVLQSLIRSSWPQYVPLNHHGYPLSAQEALDSFEKYYMKHFSNHQESDDEKPKVNNVLDNNIQKEVEDHNIQKEVKDHNIPQETVNLDDWEAQQLKNWEAQEEKRQREWEKQEQERKEEWLRNVKQEKEKRLEEKREQERLQAEIKRKEQEKKQREEAIKRKEQEEALKQQAKREEEERLRATQERQREENLRVTQQRQREESLRVTQQRQREESLRVTQQRQKQQDKQMKEATKEQKRLKTSQTTKQAAHNIDESSKPKRQEQQFQQQKLNKNMNEVHRRRGEDGGFRGQAQVEIEADFVIDNSRGLSDVMSVDVAGYLPEEIKMNVEGSILTIKGRHECGCAEGCVVNKFEKTIRLSADLDPTTLQGQVDKAGLLHLSAVTNTPPKRKYQRAATMSFEIEIDGKKGGKRDFVGCPSRNTGDDSTALRNKNIKNDFNDMDDATIESVDY